jgi:effector-binding domain-containing protein
MKKWLFGLLVILVLLVISAYIFIPTQIKISGNTLTGCDNKNISLFLHDQQKWALWWPQQPENKIEADSSFNYKDYHYRLTKPLSHGGEMQLIKKGTKFKISVSLFPINNDTTAIAWQTGFTASNNPIKRITQYFEALSMKKNIKMVIGSLGQYVNHTKNVYGIDVIKEKVKIDFFVSTKKSFPHYPTTSEVYEMIDNIRNYIASQGAKEKDYPMLNIMSLDTIQYEAHVAIPVDKKLPDNNEFSLKWMPRGGNILVTEIKGGIKTVDQSMKQFTQYVTDHQLTVMAIPFQSLITDRRKEPDTSRWITRLYYPVMQAH